MDNKELIIDFFHGEWIDCKVIQDYFGIDFETGLQLFEFSRTAEWNPHPMNGQKITIKFRLKNRIREDE